MFDEKNSGSNLPAQIDLYAEKGDEYKFLFLAKGGGSANKTYLYQQTKALLNRRKLKKVCTTKIKRNRHSRLSALSLGISDWWYFS